MGLFGFGKKKKDEETTEAAEVKASEPATTPPPAPASEPGPVASPPAPTPQREPAPVAAAPAPQPAPPLPQDTPTPAPAQPPATPSAAPAPAATMAAASNNGAAPTLADLRTAILSRFGKLHPDVIRPPMPDGVEGDLPQWPQGEAYRMLQAGDGELIFATEGLSDAFPDGRPGLNYEFLIKRPVPQDGFRGPDDLDGVFEFHFLREVALNALLWPDLGPQIDKFGTISIQLPTDAQRIPYLSHGPKGARIVALLGARKWPEIAPGKRLVSVTIILPQEASDLDALDASGRTKLAEKLEAAGHGWSSRALREPIHLNG